MIGDWTDRCSNLKDRVQDLIAKELLKFEVSEENPNVMQNPLPDHVKREGN